MKVRNILITSAGRRVTLVNIFKKTLLKYNRDGKVFAADMNPYLSSACHVSDGYFKVPRVSDENYLKSLEEICIENDISIVVPTIDPELHVLASAKKDFLKHNIMLAVSSRELCEIFYSKKSTEKFFVGNGFKTPKIVEDLRKAKYPLFAKLNNSSSSIGAMIVNNLGLALALAKNRDYIFQEYIGGEEYTVDVFVDRHGRIISIVPRLRIEVRAGEVSKGKTCKDNQIIDEVRRLVSKMDGAYGCLTVQLFKRGNEIFFIEVNPRFGGGYPLSYFAGANFAEFLIKDYLGKNLDYSDDWKDDLLMLRYDAEIIVDGSGI